MARELEQDYEQDFQDFQDLQDFERDVQDVQDYEQDVQDLQDVQDEVSDASPRLWQAPGGLGLRQTSSWQIVKIVKILLGCSRCAGWFLIFR